MIWTRAAIITADNLRIARPSYPVSSTTRTTTTHQIPEPRRTAPLRPDPRGTSSTRTPHPGPIWPQRHSRLQPRDYRKTTLAPPSSPPRVLTTTMSKHHCGASPSQWVRCSDIRLFAKKKKKHYITVVRFWCTICNKIILMLCYFLFSPHLYKESTIPLHNVGMNGFEYLKMRVKLITMLLWPIATPSVIQWQFVRIVHPLQVAIK